ncbi:alternate-type signal peptide domain-containing protein [Georgenia subflava]|uniref:Alternate-type signal peptide domain-containing protein n=1 Tax=Georgenia subflava TaxID=1622177 RepID=A0A6N7ELJ9_9MICO|nr:alternate-type signal peptide domain-containing protein [Georgenia subflava]MPV37978.1 alternate-type signal peptide domain-containing protein [Georgenia subflava]
MPTHASAHVARSRKTKAIAAGIGGIVLLAGGGASFAAWQDSEMRAGAIRAGELSLESAGGTWTLNGVGSAASVDSFTIVPGDVLTYSDTVTLTATGDNIDATLRTQLGTITGGGEHGDLRDDLVATFSISGLKNDAGDVVVGGRTVNASDAEIMHIDEPVTGTIDISATVTFPDREGQGGQGEWISFENTGLVLEQNLTQQ